MEVNSPLVHLGKYRCIVSLLVIVTCAPLVCAFQDTQTDRQRAFDLWDKSNFTESLPLLEKVAAAKPDTVVLSRLGFALYATAITIKDPNARNKQLDRAREVLRRSQEMGDNSNLTQITLDSLSSDSSLVPFSALQAAEAAMREGEDAFVHGELDKALASYERALKVDPRLYYAALYAGDVNFKKGRVVTDPKIKNDLLDQAGTWFARAIAIDPDRETAYRYWGDALMLQKKSAEARDKFVDAIVAEPYNRTAYVGLTQWADEVRAGLSHPQVKQPPPSMRSSQDEDRTTITIDPKTLNPKEGSAYYWSFYDLVRSTYKTVGFSKDYPNEEQYRHSLKEEASALRVVAETAARDVKSGKLNDPDVSLNNLMKLDNAGLIDAYVLFARPDQGIARDYVGYRKSNRDKLRRYWLEFVIDEKSR